MPFSKGVSGNPNGRKPGALNKNSARLREFITDFLDENKERIKEDFAALEPKDRLMIYERLLRYSLPTLQATTISSEFEQMTDEQLDRIIAGLKSGSYE